MKRFHFTVGLPRSGSTLLTTLLNDNKSIYASHGSNVSSIFVELDKLFPTLPVTANQLELEGLDSVLKTLYPTFFSFTNKPIVVDKIERTLPIESTLTCLQLANPNYKVVVTIRPILEVLASFIRLCRLTPDINLYDKAIKESNFSVGNYRSIDDTRCDYIMSENGPIQKTLHWLAHAKQNPQHFKIISYRELVTQPDSTMDTVYDFIGAPKHSHDFNKLNPVDLSRGDFEIYGMPTLHKVKSNLCASDTNIDILSLYAQNKYANTLDFLELPY
jgi:sulfotransferase